VTNTSSAADVKVELDDDGVAAAIQLRSDVLRLREPSEVADLVIAADRAAAKDFRPDRPSSRGQPGSMADLAARTFAAFDTLPTGAQPHLMPIHITLTSGRITSCAIDREWLARASHSDLTRALNESLATARAAHPHDLTGLLAELKATLQSYVDGLDR
jgi:hypothetical protein